jgi:hypothetical protein
VVGGTEIYDPVDDRGRNYRHGVEGVSQWLLVPRTHPRCPRYQWWRHQGRCEGRVDLLRRKNVGESARGHPRCPRHRRRMRRGRCKGRADLLRRKTIGESIRSHPQRPRHRKWMRQGRCKGQADLLRWKTVGESASQHGRWERLLDIDPPPP